MRRIFGLVLLLASSSLSSSCVVGGWSSRGGGFIWPGGLLGLLIIVGIIWLIIRR